VTKRAGAASHFFAERIVDTICELISVATPVPRRQRLTTTLAALFICLFSPPHSASVQPRSDVAHLLDRLRDKSTIARRDAALTLGSLGPAANDAIPALVQLLRDPESAVRWAGAAALGRIGPAAKDATPALAEILNDPDQIVRWASVTALDQIAPADMDIIPHLLKALRDPDEIVRQAAATAMGRRGSGAKDIIPNLLKLLNDPNDGVRRAAVKALGGLGPVPKNVVPDLAGLLKSSDANIRSAALHALADIAETIADKNQLDLTSCRYFDDVLDVIDRDQNNRLQPHEMEDRQNAARRIRRAVDHLSALEHASFINRARDWLQAVFRSGWVAWALTLYVIWLLVVFAVFLIKPLWLLELNELLKDQLSIKIKPGGIESSVGVPVSYALLLGLVAYRPRVLDAWVNSNVEKCRINLERLPTVKDRAVHIPSPAKVDDSMVMDFSPGTCRAHIGKAVHQCRWLIFGEGGVGKTSLACQMARWAIAPDRSNRLTSHVMLPVLIEDELDNPAIAQGPARFNEAIRGRLRALVGSSISISPGLLIALLRNSRVLVIIDHYTEMDQATRDQIRFDAPDFPATALVVTARSDGLWNLPKHNVSPLRIDVDQLFPFLESYLNAKQKRHLFGDEEYNAARLLLKQMTGEGRNITLLLAKMYADQIIAEKESPTGDEMAKTIPDLMLRYLNEINRNIGELDNRTVQRNCKAVAWECLEASFRPGSAERAAVITALRGDEGDEQTAESVLDYLVNRLKVVHVSGAAEDRIRFALDPLAEYLAGLQFIEESGGRGTHQKWKAFLRKTDQMPGAPETIRSFLLAMRDCCLARSGKADVPAFVIDDLNERLGLAEEMARAGIAPLIEALRNKNPEIRQSAVKQLGGRSRVAVQALCGALDDEESAVRREAAWSLLQIVMLGDNTGFPVSRLIDALADPDADVRWKAAAALEALGTSASEAIGPLLKVLKSDPESRPRGNAAAALAKISNGSTVVRTLVEVLSDGDNNVATAAVTALGEIGPPAREAVPSLLTAYRDFAPAFRGYVVRALGKIGSASREVIQALSESITTSGKSECVAECSALGDLGPAAESAVPVLIKAMENPVLRRAAAEALGKIGAPVADVVPALTFRMQDADRGVRLTVAESLGRIGPAARDATERLIAVANSDGDGLVRVHAANSLMAMTRDPAHSIDVLCKCLSHADGPVRKLAAESLGKPGYEGEIPVLALATALKDSEFFVRAAAAESLGTMGSIAAAAVTHLVAAFQDVWQPSQNQLGTARFGDGPIYDLVRCRCAIALGKIGSSARSAIPALKDTSNRQKAVRETARDAIALIERAL
jgi:HEAT repeat protein